MCYNDDKKYQKNEVSKIISNATKTRKDSEIFSNSTKILNKHNLFSSYSLRWNSTWNILSHNICNNNVIYLLWKHLKFEGTCPQNMKYI